MDKVLAHSPQVINEYNEVFGLEGLSGEVLEAFNKLIRRYRERLSRKFSSSENESKLPRSSACFRGNFQNRLRP